jgi:DinB family protein
MDERTRLLERLDHARQQMKDVIALADVDHNQRIYNPWRMKEVMDHIAGWDDAVIVALRSHLEEREPETPAARGIDFYNAETVSTREALPYELSLREFEASRLELKRIISAMPDARFAQPLTFPWGGRGTVTRIVEIFIEHEEEHAKEILSILQTVRH